MHALRRDGQALSLHSDGPEIDLRRDNLMLDLGHDRLKLKLRTPARRSTYVAMGGPLPSTLTD